MHCFLNGGRNERAVLKYQAAQDLYRQLEVFKILFIPFAFKEDFWRRLWQDDANVFGVPDLNVRTLNIYDSDQADILQAIEWGDFIYLPDGFQETLLKRMTDFGTDQILRQIVNSSELKLLGGGSTGPMVRSINCLVVIMS